MYVYIYIYYSKDKKKKNQITLSFDLILISFFAVHEEFRLPELESLAKIENVNLSYNINDYKRDVSLKKEKRNTIKTY